MKRWIVGGGVSIFLIGIVSAGCGGASSGAVTKAGLGKDLFFDTRLSNPVGQSCGTCHSANRSFTDPRGGITSEGALTGIFGSRQSNTAMYMAFSPDFRFDAVDQDFIGWFVLDEIEKGRQGDGSNNHPHEALERTTSRALARTAPGKAEAESESLEFRRL